MLVTNVSSPFGVVAKRDDCQLSRKALATHLARLGFLGFFPYNPRVIECGRTNCLQQRAAMQCHQIRMFEENTNASLQS
ncbi:hypothetical protein N9L89_03300, partial [Gammaproteobacteria bacterium]|nr:hypothetical protein [Gammaproteobacteria bacterium]